MFTECLLCAGDPVGYVVTKLPASQPNRKTCSQKRAETIDLTIIKPGPKLLFQLQEASPGFKGCQKPNQSPHVPCSQSHLHRRLDPQRPEVMKSSILCPESAPLDTTSARTPPGMACLLPQQGKLLIFVVINVFYCGLP